MIIVSLFLAIICETKLFAKNNRGAWKQKLVLVQTIIFYFALGLVQPTVFDSIMCPLFVMAVAVCREQLHEQSAANLDKENFNNEVHKRHGYRSKQK